MAGHSLGIIPISLSKMLERCGYYGMRSIILIYLVNGPMQLPHEKVNSFYGIFTLVIGIMPIIGGITGDFLIGSKRSVIVGALLEALGCFLLAVPNGIAIYAGIILIALGVGLYSPNVLSMLSYLYRDRPQKADAAMFIFYVAINIGAMTGAFIIGMLSSITGYFSGFIFAGILILLSQMVLLLMNKTLDKVPLKPNITNESDSLPQMAGIVGIVACTFLVPVFWLLTQLSEPDITMAMEKLMNGLGAIVYMINPMVVTSIGILFAILFFFVETSSILKILIGFFIYALSFFVLLQGDGDNAALLVFALVLQAIAELFISAVALSFIIQHVPLRLNTLVISLYVVVANVISSLSAFVFRFKDSLLPGTLYWISIGIVMVIAVVFLVIYIVFKNENIKPEQVTQSGTQN